MRGGNAVVSVCCKEESSKDGAFSLQGSLHTWISVRRRIEVVVARNLGQSCTPAEAYWRRMCIPHPRSWTLGSRGSTNPYVSYACIYTGGACVCACECVRWDKHVVHNLDV